MIRVCVITADVAGRPAVIERLEAAGIEVVGQGRTAADAQRLGPTCEVLLVDDLGVMNALAGHIRRPVIGLLAAVDDPAGDELAMAAAGAGAVLTWPASAAQIRAAAEQVHRRGRGDEPRPAAPPRSRPTDAGGRTAGGTPAGGRTAGDHVAPDTTHVPAGSRSEPSPPAVRSAGRAPAPPRDGRRRPRLVVIGASAGGPAALATLLSAVDGLSVPIVIAQHLHPAFAQSLQAWLGRAAGRSVGSATDGLRLTPGMIVLAGCDRDLRIDAEGRCRLGTREGAYTPSIDVLLHSVAEAYGPTAIGVILTGMGADGAEGLLAMREQGALTIAQDQHTSAVFGMPAAAARNGAAAMVLPLTDIAATIRRAVERDAR